jgi:transcriptional regulator with XRE-family HTH domain
MKQGIIVPKEELEAFGRRVRSIREAMRLKQNEFAAGLDLSEGYICKIEKGKGNPTYEFFFKLVSKYNVNLDYLFYGEGDLFFQGKKAVEENKERFDSSDGMDELMWLLEHSELFKRSILSEANKILYGNRKRIEEDIKQERNKRKANINYAHQKKKKP